MGQRCVYLTCKCGWGGNSYFPFSLGAAGIGRFVADLVLAECVSVFKCLLNFSDLVLYVCLNGVNGHCYDASVKYLSTFLLFSKKRWNCSP